MTLEGTPGGRDGDSCSLTVSPPSLETQKHPVHCTQVESWGRQAGQAPWAGGLCEPQGAEGRGVRTPLTT